jgi:outer membrane protein assembly factor BamC
VTDFPYSTAPRAAVLGIGLALLVALGACSSIEDFAAGDKADYRGSAKSTKPAGLEVPPDLTRLAADTRYLTQGGTVSAATFQSGVAAGAAASAATTATPLVAPQAVGDLRVVREGSQRWLSTSQPPEQIWPQLEAFWQDRGIKLATNDAAAGVMETEWLENRAKLPDDVVSNTLGKLFKSLYSTGERDKFRTRVERTAGNGSEIYVSHRGVEEVFNSVQKDSTTWQPRPVDPQLEAEFLSRIMVKLAPVKAEQARASVATAPSARARARVLAGRPASALQIDDAFDRAWRRVGLALDRSGFTVEDRDRAQGLYFVRYVDPAQAGKEEPGFFAKLFSKEPVQDTGPVRYRVAVKGEGEASTVSVLTSQGAPETGDAGRRIVALLVEDLK